MKHLLIASLIVAVFVPFLLNLCFGAAWAEFGNTSEVSAIASTNVLGGADVLAGTNGGIIQWREGGLLGSYGVLDGLPSGNVTAMANDPAYGLAIGTDSGALLVSTSGIRHLDASNGLGDDMVFDLAFDPDGRLLAGTLKGIAIIDDIGGILLNTDNGLPADRIISVLADLDRSIWVGTSGFGAANIASERITLLTTADGLAGDFIYDIAHDPMGRIVFATDGGVSVFDDLGIRGFRPPEDASETAILCLKTTTDSVLCGGPAGLFELAGDEFQRVQHGEWLQDRSVQAITTDSDGVVVIALQPLDP
ncbi:MAG: hypothetical protein JW941_10765, partial [Candidatus Coatesbacteria bacterium]|nr:hypothetical protein [Candidatus Coatesbacteria bacterium]